MSVLHKERPDVHRETDALTLQGPPPGILAPVRIAVWDEGGATIHTEELLPTSEHFLEELVSTTHALAQKQGGSVPLPALGEVIANLLHAHFADASVTIMARGSTIVVADRGPGVADPDQALLPGYSTATAAQRRYMRGTGMGLPLAKAAIEAAGGKITIRSNLSHGTVVCLNMAPQPAAEPGGAPGRPRLSNREKRVLSLLSELGTAGPSVIARDLAMPLSTAHRLLTRLEDADLVVRDAKGKRRLSQRGVQHVGLIFTE
jgi:hypothetical protein